MNPYILSLISCLFSAVYNLLTKFCQNFDPVFTMMVTNFVRTVLYTLYFIHTKNRPMHSYMESNNYYYVFGIMFLSGLFSFIYNMVGYVAFLSHISPGIHKSFGGLEMIMITILSCYLFHTPITPSMIVGMLFIILGSSIITIYR